MKRWVLTISALLGAQVLAPGLVLVAYGFSDDVEDELSLGDLGDVGVSPPSEIIGHAIPELQEIREALRVGSVVSKGFGVGGQDQRPKRALSKGVALYRQGAYRSATWEFSRYLEEVQVPDGEDSTQALYLKGVAHQRLGESRAAIQNYLKYLSAYSKHQNGKDPQALDVVDRVLSVAVEDLRTGRQDINRLLSSIASMRFDGRLHFQVRYHLAKAALMTGNSHSASEWIYAIEEGVKSGPLLAKTLFLKSVVHLTGNRAKQALRSVRKILAVNDDDVEDYALLALGRILMRQGKYRTSLAAYSRIEEKSPHFRTALYEGIYANTALGLYEEARNDARRYLSLKGKPRRKEAVALRRILSYLSLRSGDASATDAEIDRSIKRFEGFADWLRSLYVGKRRVYRRDLEPVFQRLGDEINHPYLTAQGFSAYRTLDSLRHQLERLRNSIRVTLFTLGQQSAGSLRPEWKNRAKQIHALGRRLMVVGHYLAAGERRLYERDLKPAEYQKLAASQLLRTELRGRGPKSVRDRVRWLKTAKLLGSSARVRKSRAKMEVAHSRLMGMRYQFRGKEKVSAKSEGNSLEVLLRRSRGIRRKLDHADEIVAMERTNQISQSSFMQSEVRYLIQYSMALLEESRVFERFRQSRVHQNGRIFGQDFIRGWALWRQTVREVLEQSRRLEGQMKDGVREILVRMDRAEETYSRLLVAADVQEERLAALLGSSGSFIRSYYMEQVGERLARYNKWAGDLDLLRLRQVRRKTEAANDDHALQKQILDDQLDRLNHGVIWSWPN